MRASGAALVQPGHTLGDQTKVAVRLRFRAALLAKYPVAMVAAKDYLRQELYIDCRPANVDQEAWKGTTQHVNNHKFKAKRTHDTSDGQFRVGLY